MPLCVSSVIVRLTLDMAGIILTARDSGSSGSARSAIAGVGSDDLRRRQYLLDQWWVPTVPGIAIFVVSLGFNLLGDGLRDVLDPKSER